MKFSEKITISSGFKRSIDLQKDQLDKNVLQHYLCPPSSEQVLHAMYQHLDTGTQSAFTWTGPYGSGKSSLAVFLSALVSGDRNAYKVAANKLNIYKNELLSVFSYKQKRKIITVLGRPENPCAVLAEALMVENNSQTILAKLEELSYQDNGIILFIDEMGKFLEKATFDASIDVYLFQQIAELANRSDGKFIFISILHQSFAEYSRNLSKNLRDEWIKIQGRFIDLAINAAGEEQIDLISRAIISDNKPLNILPMVDITAQIIAKNRPVKKEIFAESLNACFPLHPCVAILLSPVSRRRFGQNQRSIFSFLSSAEPFGFQSFIHDTDFSTDKYYTPDLYWDYLRTNFENSILASSDAKNWAIAIEAINKVSAAGCDEITQNILKTIAVIDIFKGTSGLTADGNILKTIFTDINMEEELNKLQSLSVIRHNKFSDSYALFEGSDFNIDDELSEAFKQITDIDFQKLNQLASFRPIVAKRHYHETGAMRWMDIKLIPAHILKTSLQNHETQAFGEFLIAIPKDVTEFLETQMMISKHKADDINFPILLGLPNEYERLLNDVKELLALEWLRRNSTLLSGDKVARREIENRHGLIAQRLELTLENILHDITWIRDGKNIGTLANREMSSYASNLANNTFNKSPYLKSEMLNRQQPSGNANAALNALLKRMVLNNGEKHLGIEGFPAEGGLCKILLEDTGLYILKNKEWQFKPPKNDSKKLHELWSYTDKILMDASSNVTLKTIYEQWEKPPFGIKKGLHTFLIACYLLAEKRQVAAYLDDIYTPDIDDLFIDYLTKDTSNISLRYVDNERGNKQDIISTLTAKLRTESSLNLSLQPNASSLDIARELVRLTDRLNLWVLRTRKLSKNTIQLRELLKSAQDPNKLIFDDLSALFKFNDDIDTGMKLLVDALKELMDAYPALLKQLMQILANELELKEITDTSLHRLRERAQNVKQASGDFRINAFIARLENFHGSEEDIVGIGGLGANKPIYDWIDFDAERAAIEIAVLCDGFKQAELYVRVQGRAAQRHAIAITSGLSGETQTHHSSFNILEDYRDEINNIKACLTDAILSEENPEFVLAAITELSIEYMNFLKNDKDIKKKAVGNE